MRKEEHDIIELRERIDDLEIDPRLIALGDGGILCSEIDVRASHLVEFVFEDGLLEDLVVLRLEEELESYLLALGIDGQGRIDSDLLVSVYSICRDHAASSFGIGTFVALRLDISATIEHGECSDRIGLLSDKDVLDDLVLHAVGTRYPEHDLIDAGFHIGMGDLVGLYGPRILVREIPLIIDDRLIGFYDEIHRIAPRRSDRDSEYLRSEDGFYIYLFFDLGDLAVIVASGELDLLLAYGIELHHDFLVVVLGLDDLGRRRI